VRIYIETTIPSYAGARVYDPQQLP
jgi:hypothetical protein